MNNRWRSICTSYHSVLHRLWSHHTINSFALGQSHKSSVAKKQFSFFRSEGVHGNKQWVRGKAYGEGSEWSVSIEGTFAVLAIYTRSATMFHPDFPPPSAACQCAGQIGCLWEMKSGSAHIMEWLSLSMAQGPLICIPRVPCVTGMCKWSCPPEHRQAGHCW